MDDPAYDVTRRALHSLLELEVALSREVTDLRTRAWALYLRTLWFVPPGTANRKWQAATYMHDIFPVLVERTGWWRGEDPADTLVRCIRVWGIVIAGPALEPMVESYSRRSGPRPNPPATPSPGTRASTIWRALAILVRTHPENVRRLRAGILKAAKILAGPKRWRSPHDRAAMVAEVEVAFNALRGVGGDKLRSRSKRSFEKVVFCSDTTLPAQVVLDAQGLANWIRKRQAINLDGRDDERPDLGAVAPDEGIIQAETKVAVMRAVEAVRALHARRREAKAVDASIEDLLGTGGRTPDTTLAAARGINRKTLATWRPRVLKELSNLLPG